MQTCYVKWQTIVCIYLKFQGFDELLELAEKGDHRNADILVRDIYGGDYKVLGLPGDLIASSFGKVCAKRNSSHGEYDGQITVSPLKSESIWRWPNRI